MTLINLNIIETKRYRTATAVVKTTTTPLTTVTSINKTVVPKVLVETQEELALKRMVASQTTRSLIYSENAIDLEENKVTYVTASNGIFILLRTPIAIFSMLHEKFETPLNHLLPMKEGFQLLIPKIDIKYLLQALSYYKDIHTQDKTEASVLYFWNHTDDLDFTSTLNEAKDLPGLEVDGRLLIYCPKQKNTGTLSDFESDPWVHWFRSHTTVLLESHSHHVMNAFWSATDDANENMNEFYLVWGQIKTNEKFCLRYCFRNIKFVMDLNPQDLFTWPTITRKLRTEIHSELEISGDISDVVENQTNELLISENQQEVIHEPSKTETLFYPGPFKMVAYPGDWIAQHTSDKGFASKTYAGYNNGTTYYGGQNWNGNKKLDNQKLGVSKFEESVVRDFEIVEWDDIKKSYVYAGK